MTPLGRRRICNTSSYYKGFVMATPVTSVRSLPEHAPLIRRLAAALRADPAMAGRIEAVLAGAPVAENGTGGLHNYGPFGGEAQALAILRDRLVAALDPLELHLFGSRGRGTARPDSDFDLLVVLPDAVGEAGLDPLRAYAPVMGLGIGADVVPCLASDFEAEKDIPGTIAHDAKRGRLIYRPVAG
ncbi:MAG: nucleotidyltransferase domain-containing protein [Alphaproteobacteria bacterium]|nr:nucleotidyltransferase domain-containing protein [Alphaproteobacteria bacterium]